MKLILEVIRFLNLLFPLSNQYKTEEFTLSSLLPLLLKMYSETMSGKMQVLLCTCRDGFGNLSKDGDFWWGLENIYNVTNQKGRPYRLRIDIIHSGNTLSRAQYRDVRIAGESSQYKIETGRYDYKSSNATDYLDTYRYVF